MNKRMLLLCIALAVALLTGAIPAAARDAAAPSSASSLGNYVWLDSNGNGWHDQAGDAPEAEFGPAGIDGVKINLYLDTNKNGVIDPGEWQATTTTGDNPSTPGIEKGWYLFPGITANGNQFIVEVDSINFAFGGPLAGMMLTSGTTFGPNPLVKQLTQIAVDYADADFGFQPNPLKISKTVLNTTPYVLPGNTVTFQITVTNTGTQTINPAPLDDFYSPACLQFVSAALGGQPFPPNAIDAANGWLHWINVGPIGPGGVVTIDVTFTAISPTPAPGGAASSGMAWKEGGWKDYAPKGIPDFDERQAGLDNPNLHGTGWYADGPAVAANSLWWFDSKFEPGSTPPPAISDGYKLIKSYNTFTPSVVWDDHDPRNVRPLMGDLSTLMGTAFGAGTSPSQLATGVTQYITGQGLGPDYTITTQAKPTFQWVGDEVRASEDVMLLLGFWQESPAGGAPVRVGGHWVTSAGIDLLNAKIGVSDPMRNQAEGAGVGSGAGRVLPGLHTNHPGSVGAAGDTVHNDAQYISQDVYRSGQLGGTITAGSWGMQAYVDPNPVAGCSQVAAFQGQNVPTEFSGQTGACNTNGGALWTAVEYAVAVSPTSNTLLCTPTTNIAAVTDAQVEGSQTVLPPVQDETRVTEGMDFGDLIDAPYPTVLASNGARHLIMSPLRLGLLIDDELDGQPTANATGDDNAKLDDEDGVSATPGYTWQPGTVAAKKGGSLQITISGGTGVPQLFMDFGSGLSAVPLLDATGAPLALTPWLPATHTVYFDIPPATPLGAQVPTRVRLSSAGGLSASGLARDGEVEDYIMNVPTALTLATASAATVPFAGAGEVAALALVVLAVAWIARRTLATRAASRP